MFFEKVDLKILYSQLLQSNLPSVPYLNFNYLAIAMFFPLPSTSPLNSDLMFTKSPLLEIMQLAQPTKVLRKDSCLPYRIAFS